MLRQVDHDGTHVDACDCGGLWFDPGEIAAWARVHRIRGALPDATVGWPRAGDPLACPRCPDAMLQRRVLDRVSFARCERCRGVWLTPEGVARLDPEPAADRTGSGSVLAEALLAFLQLLPW